MIKVDDDSNRNIFLQISFSPFSPYLSATSSFFLDRTIKTFYRKDRFHVQGVSFWFFNLFTVDALKKKRTKFIRSHYSTFNRFFPQQQQQIILIIIKWENQNIKIKRRQPVSTPSESDCISICLRIENRANRFRFFHKQGEGEGRGKKKKRGFETQL